MQLSTDQQAALAELTTNPRREKSLSGPAGSGKTTLIVEALEALDEDTMICTPTNKAAQVLQSKGLYQAQTLYKPFFVPVTVEDERTKKKYVKFVACCDYTEPLPTGKTAWTDAPVIIDESSMLKTWMVAKLRKMCAQLILVGDPHQLPPVDDQLNPTGYFNTRQHDAKLTRIHRQGADSPILQLATDIRSRSPNVTARIKRFVPDLAFEKAIFDGYQFIAFTNRERQRLNLIIREALGFRSILPTKGDRLLSTNNYSDEIVNGTPLICHGFVWDGESRLATVEVETPAGDTETLPCDVYWFMRDQLESATRYYTRFKVAQQNSVEEMNCVPLQVTFGYCLTAHKAQGSEYEKVCVIDQRNVILAVAENERAQGRETLTGEEYSRRWLYTAVTRAKKDLIVAQPWWAVLPETEDFLA